MCLLLATGADAQDFPDTQVLANRVLFAAQDAAQERRAAEQRRVDEIGRRADQQAVALQEQATVVRRLESELQAIKDERRLIQLAEAFDAAVRERRWPDARALLADVVTVDPVGQPIPPEAMAADSFIAGLPASLAGSAVLPRSNQEVRIDGEHAVLTSDGYAWGRADNAKGALAQRAGKYEYRFLRTAEGWKIEALFFRRNYSAP